MIEKRCWNIMEINILRNKSETIRKCLKRAREDYTHTSADFLTDYTRQDAVILNLERASQAAIDAAAHIVRVKNLGVPQKTTDVFLFLEQNNLLTKQTSQNMQKMVGFRNIAVHDYQKLNIDIVVSIIKNHLTDFEIFIKEILNIK